MALSISFTWVQMLLALVCFSLLWIVFLVFYRLWLSPIVSFPGPFLARITFWYEFYYDWVKVGTYYLKIEEMHRTYGPIVRVTPEELHVADSSFYSQLFVPAAVRKTNNYPRFGQGTGFEDMVATITDHDIHRQIRSTLAPFFSRAGITRVEPRVAVRVRKLCGRFMALQDSGTVVNLNDAFGSLTNDVISSVIFEEPSDFLGDPTFNKTWFATLKRGALAVPLFAHLPWLARALTSPIIRLLAKRAMDWTIWDDKARRQILRTKLRPSDEAKTRDDTTVFDHLVHSDVKEAQLGGPGGFARLMQLIQQAGTYNISQTLSLIITFLHLEMDKRNALRSELEIFFDEHPEPKPSWRDLEKLPYLTAVIKEGLRMSIVGMQRMPRVAPDVALRFGHWTIPAGVPVSMSSYWMHMDPEVFPNPHSFRPERWLGEPESLKLMQSHFVPFAKGSRNCLGSSLTSMQMYHTLAQLFRPGAPKFVLYETDETDAVAIHGLLFPMPRLASKGVRVLFVS